MLGDPLLSWKSKGILSYLLGQPDNWVVQITDLINHSPSGEEIVRSALKELRGLRYLVVRPLRDEKTGKLKGRELLVFDRPQDPKSRGEPKYGKSRSSVNLPHNKNEYGNKNEEKCDAGASPAFNGFVYNGELDDSSSKEAKDLTKQFYEHLVKHRLHLGRSDYPHGESDQSKKKRKATRRKWVQACDRLIEQQEGNVHKIKRVMNWYFDHCREPWSGSYIAMTTFCDNFFKIEKAMRRATGEEEDRSSRKPSITVYEI